MATTFQLLLRGLDGRTSCLRFPSSTIAGSLLQEQIAPIFGIPAEALLIVTGTRVINPRTSLYASSDGFFPSCSLLMRLRGGKGGFGSLLRGAATKAGQKKTSNFDACRDMSGRRLRHVNAEKKLKEWKAQAKERELERTANEFLKKQVKQKEDESGCSQVIEKFREETSRARDEVESAVARGLAEAKRLGKRKILEDSIPATSSKRVHTWFSNEIDMMEEGLEDEREDSEDEDDQEGSKGDDAKEGSEDEVTEEGSEDKTQSSEDKKLEEGSDDDKAEQGSEAEKVEGNSVGENVEARSAEEFADTRSEEEEAERTSSFNKAEERFEERDDSNRFDIGLVKKNIQQVDVVEGDGHSTLSTTARAAHVDVDAQKHFCQEKRELRSNILQNCSDSTCNENGFHNELSNTSFVSVEIKDSPVQEKLNLDDFLHASELEVLGLERLKHELQERGLKCGGSLAERAGRLFLLKTVSIEKLDKKHFAKGRM